jgi:hypothetical protein
MSFESIKTAAMQKPLPVYPKPRAVQYSSAQASAAMLSKFILSAKSVSINNTGINQNKQ